MLSMVWLDIQLQEMSIWTSYLWNKMISVCRYWEFGSLVFSGDWYLQWSITYKVGADVLERILGPIPYHN